jgi:lipopolysaccharide transport system ATP-binding protein
MTTAISIENISKQYRLGNISTGSLALDFQRWWARVRGRPDPWSTIGEEDHDKRDGEFIWALRDISFQVQQGEVLGIIGRNGAGKSTLLKILSRVTAPTTGRIRVKGRIASLLEVGTGFHPDLTGKENIYLNGAILGMTRSEIDNKFDEIVDFAEIEKFIDTPVKRYSSGMYVRLAFAVAAHLEPEILIVDEVLAVGDAEFQKKCLGKMGDVAKEGRTVLFVSHNMGAINNLCQRGILINEGVKIDDGPAKYVTDRYLSSVSNSSNHNYEISKLTRSSDRADRFRFTYLTINNGEPICHGEKLEVILGFETYSNLSGVSVGFGFSSVEGFRILTVDSDLSDREINILSNKKGEVKVTIDKFALQPGRYLLDLGARSSNFPLDYLPGCITIDVLPGPTTPGNIIRSDGGVRIPATIEWSCI